jgi:hypothetical protein
LSFLGILRPLKNLAPGDRIDLASAPKEGWIGRLQKNL